MHDLVIFGAGELGGMARQYAVEDHGRNIAAFVVDASFKKQDVFHDIPVVSWPDMRQRFNPADTDFFIAVGYRSMRRRREVYENVQQAGYSCINLVSPASYVSETSHIGENNMIFPGVVVEPGVFLGNNNVLWSNTTICHDSVIGDHNFFAANVTLGGRVRIGDSNFIGFSATVLQDIAVGDETLIGAQALIHRPTDSLRQYWGVPAKERGTIDPVHGVCVE
ncbi:hypothetical protein AU192_07170 [Mycobacterium lehmannii]|uniref:PglD N-terminal domain-containing protein n=1 Tax=Mycobacterium lehmannii TaxID=2048550 RepID=A0A124EPI2_9MYCO|nr:NeuD/PglB/VioB family sugar acetyltransferase [Mycobacterium lehmannii]KUI15638.1 hypothetical protein AU192_07170 [Mycobacterium lehmannii]